MSESSPLDPWMVPTPSAGAALAQSAEAGIRLAPEDPFPPNLSALDLVQVQVLHSKVSFQLDHDYRTGPAGPHPCTTDRHHDLVAELAARDAARTPG